MFKPYLLHPATASLISTHRKNLCKVTSCRSLCKPPCRCAPPRLSPGSFYFVPLFVVNSRVFSVSLFSSSEFKIYYLKRAISVRFSGKRWGYGPPQTSHPRINLRLLLTTSQRLSSSSSCLFIFLSTVLNGYLLCAFKKYKQQSQIANAIHLSRGESPNQSLLGRELGHLRRERVDALARTIRLHAVSKS